MKIKRPTGRPRIPLHYALVLPAVLVMVFTMLIPLANSFWSSLHRHSLLYPGNKSFIGFGNYIEVLTDPTFLNSVIVTLVFVVGAVVLETLIGGGFALALNRAVKGQNVIRTLLLIPVMLTPVVAGLMWVFMYNAEAGIINYLLELFGISDGVVWLGDPSIAIFSVIIVDVWRNTPFVFLMLLAGLQSLPTDPYEAATVDGASRFQVLRYITIPLLKPILVTTVIIRAMDAFREFDLIYILTGGGPANSTEVLSMLAYEVGFRHFNIGKASAISYLILVIVLIFGLGFIRKMRNMQIES